MARLPRLSVAGHLHLVVQRARQGRVVFVTSADHDAYLNCLREAAATHRVAIHAYALTSGEVRLLATPSEAGALARMIQSVGRRFIGGYNQRHDRSGPLWEGRFKATVVDPAEHFMPCLRYVESAPLEAGLVSRLEDYRWSSAAHHAGVSRDSLVTEHPHFWALGNTPFEREASYKNLMKRALTVDESLAIQDAVLKTWVLGSDRFVAALRAHTERRMKRLPRGRPGRA